MKDASHRLAYRISMSLNPTTLGAVAAVAFSLMFGMSGKEKLLLFTVSFGFGVLIPFLYLAYLKISKRVEAIDVPRREQRTIPYLIGICCYFTGLALLLWISAPWPLVALLASYLINTAIVLVINYYWKISAHATGVGAVVTGFAYAVSPYYLIALILLPIVSWARITLDVHSRGQVIAGSILSVIFTAVQYEMVYRLYGM